MSKYDHVNSRLHYRLGGVPLWHCDSVVRRFNRIKWKLTLVISQTSCILFVKPMTSSLLYKQQNRRQYYGQHIPKTNSSSSSKHNTLSKALLIYTIICYYFTRKYRETPVPIRPCVNCTSIKCITQKKYYWSIYWSYKCKSTFYVKNNIHNVPFVSFVTE